MVEVDVAAFDISEVSKTLKKSCVVRPLFFSTPCMPQDTDSGDSACLRMHKAWQRSYPTADEWKEIAPSHWAVEIVRGKATPLM
jgi:hypothetical protein